MGDMTLDDESASKVPPPDFRLRGVPLRSREGVAPGPRLCPREGETPGPMLLRRDDARVREPPSAREEKRASPPPPLLPTPLRFGVPTVGSVPELGVSGLMRVVDVLGVTSKLEFGVGGPVEGTTGGHWSWRVGICASIIKLHIL